MNIAEKEFVKGLRGSIARWYSEKNAARTQEIIGESLHAGNLFYPGEEADGEKEYVDSLILASTTKTPSWIELHGLGDAIAELSSSGSWRALIEKSPGALNEYIDSQAISAKSASSLISRLNAKLMTVMLVAGVLGAIEGPDIVHRPMGSLVKGLAHDVGSHFTTAADTPEEFLRRMSLLVPNPDKSRDATQPTLMDFMTRNNVFRLETSKGTRTCPAVPLTELLLGQWGRQLDTDSEYRSRFMDTLTNRNRSRIVFKRAKSVQ